MAADIRSHVLRREEKGFLGIPFKRWLLSGVGGGMTFAISSVLLPRLAFPLGALLALSLLILTVQRHGMPLWQRLLYRLRGRLAVHVHHHPHSPAQHLVQLLDIPVQAVIQLDGDRLFAPRLGLPTGDITEWISRAEVEDADFIVLDQALPLEGR